VGREALLGATLQGGAPFSLSLLECRRADGPARRGALDALEQEVDVVSGLIQHVHCMLLHSLLQ
jgi:hypothetical protein